MRVSELDGVERNLLFRPTPFPVGVLQQGLHQKPRLRTLRLRRASEPLPPWYSGRDIGELDYLPLGQALPWPSCECCGKETSTLRAYSDMKPLSVCHECSTMLRFAGIPLMSVSLPASEPLPADWHRAALPAQPFRPLQKVG